MVTGHIQQDISESVTTASGIMRTLEKKGTLGEDEFETPASNGNQTERVERKCERKGGRERSRG